LSLFNQQSLRKVDNEKKVFSPLLNNIHPRSPPHVIKKRG